MCLRNSVLYVFPVIPLVATPFGIPGPLSSSCFHTQPRKAARRALRDPKDASPRIEKPPLARPDLASGGSYASASRFVPPTAFPAAPGPGTTTETTPGRGEAGHAQDRWRQGRSYQAERPLARAEARVAVLAVIPGALQFDLAQRRREGLAPATGVSGLRAARAGLSRTLLLGAVGVQAPGDRPAHDPQRQPPGRRLDRLEVDVVRGPRADPARGFGRDLRRDARRKAPFFAASPRSHRLLARCAFQNRSLTSISSRTSPRGVGIRPRALALRGLRRAR